MLHVFVLLELEVVERLLEMLADCASRIVPERDEGLAIHARDFLKILQG